MSNAEPKRPSDPHTHTWVEGPNGHSICELCGRAYSPVHDLKAAYDEVYALRQEVADLRLLLKEARMTDYIRHGRWDRLRERIDAALVEPEVIDGGIGGFIESVENGPSEVQP